MFGAAYLYTCCLAFASIALAASSNESSLVATALVTNSQNHTAIECWKFTPPFTASSSSGTSGALTFNFEDLANATYTVIPGRFNGGQHNAPHPQLVAFFSGMAHITLPDSSDSSDEAWILGGANGLIVAVDTTGSGHITTYPSDEQTIALQIAFAGEAIPPHTVLKTGACEVSSQIISN
ncbi:MAG: hypothetical protein M1834_004855 [Cirrosporium novae-zelandiae]|nr:MAG: hypothetical protein M1834_004855 [Cirrosporium novae-zelandiae]